MSVRSTESAGWRRPGRGRRTPVGDGVRASWKGSSATRRYSSCTSWKKFLTFSSLRTSCRSEEARPTRGDEGVHQKVVEPVHQLEVRAARLPLALVHKIQRGVHDELVEVRGVVLLGGATAAEIRLVQGDVLAETIMKVARPTMATECGVLSLVGRKSSGSSRPKVFIAVLRGDGLKGKGDAVPRRAQKSCASNETTRGLVMASA